MIHTNSSNINRTAIEGTLTLSPTKKKNNITEGKRGNEEGKRTPKTPKHPLLDAKITLKELVEAITKMKYGKAVGPDGILTEYLKFV